MLDDETGDIRPEHTHQTPHAIELRADPAPAQVDDAPAPRHRYRPEPELPPAISDDEIDADTLERWEKLSAERAGFPLTPELDRLNAFTKETTIGSRMFFYYRRRLLDMQQRYLVNMGGDGAKVLFDAVVARTVGFRKYAEQITYENFIDGLRDGRGELVLLDGQPAFAGLGVTRKTFIRWRKALLETGLVEALEFTNRRGTAVAYMLSRRFIERCWGLSLRDMQEDDEVDDEEVEQADRLASMVMQDVWDRWEPPMDKIFEPRYRIDQLVIEEEQDDGHFFKWERELAAAEEREDAGG